MFISSVYMYWTDMDKYFSVKIVIFYSVKIMMEN